MCPVGLHEVLRREIKIPSAIGRGRAGVRADWTEAQRRIVCLEHEFIRRRRLPGYPSADLPILTTENSLLAEIRRIEHRMRRLVVVISRDVILIGPLARR